MGKKEDSSEVSAENLVKSVDLEKEKLLKLSEISLILDTYDDIFSDFDPRPFSERSLSDDFLVEAKKASRDRKGSIELSFLIPTAKKNSSEEGLIKRRLREHFKRHYDLIQNETKGIVKRGLGFVIAGIVVMFFAAFILSREFGNALWASFLIILLEPAGWFLFWEGLNQVIFESRRTKSELEFYEKMSRCDIKFSSY